MNEVRIEWADKRIMNERRTDKTRTKLTEKTLITSHSHTSIHTNKTKHQNKV